MIELEVMTILGNVTLMPGDKFQCRNGKHESCMYQYIGLMEDDFGSTVYMHDETHDKFCNVSQGWFASRTIKKIGDDEF